MERSGGADREQLAACAQRQELGDRRPDRQRLRLCGVGSIERLPPDPSGRRLARAKRRRHDRAAAVQCDPGRRSPLQVFLYRPLSLVAVDRQWRQLWPADGDLQPGNQRPDDRQSRSGDPEWQCLRFLHRHRGDAFGVEHRVCVLVEQGHQLEHAGFRARYLRGRGGLP